ncbi:MAG: hypothetical protein GX455_03475, partial [Phycisphaerae bacterium]|nr:hypothetical protein [Phycisphaerae bacterium]
MSGRRIGVWMMVAVAAAVMTGCAGSQAKQKPAAASQSKAAAEKAKVEPGALEVEYLRCEYRVNPLGIDAAAPRLSW